MKITVISELTIYNDLVKLCRNKSIMIEKRIALSTEKISLENRIYINPVTHVQNIIFQSNNILPLIYFIFTSKLQINVNSYTTFNIF